MHIKQFADDTNYLVAQIFIEDEVPVIDFYRAGRMIESKAYPNLSLRDAEDKALTYINEQCIM